MATKLSKNGSSIIFEDGNIKWVKDWSEYGFRQVSTTDISVYLESQTPALKLFDGLYSDLLNADDSDTPFTETTLNSFVASAAASGAGGDASDARYLFNGFSLSLADTLSIDSGWLDMRIFDKYQFEGRSGVAGMSMKITSSSVNGGGRGDDVITETIITSTFRLFNVTARGSFMRFEWINKTGSPIDNCSLNIKAFKGSSDKLSVFDLSTNPSIFGQAGLVQAVLKGLPAGATEYKNISSNSIGALLTANFGTEVARDLFDGWRVFTKYGRNPDIDTGTVPEDIYNGGGRYTGFNATQNENLRFLSSSSQDAGTLVSNGTATGGTDTTLIDTTATFITDTVAIGDCLINDTEGAHGFITAINSETEITVFRMTNGDITRGVNAAGDSYRIATTNGTGCAVLRFQSILDSSFNKQSPKYAILNGVTPVIVPVNAMRGSTGFSVLSGSSEQNVGQITVTQETTTSNVFAVIPTTGRTTIGCSTVPNGYTYLIKRLRIALVRANGSAGSGTVVLYTREPFGSWVGLRVFEIQDGGGVDFTLDGGITLLEANDFRFTCTYVSDTNSVIEVGAEIYEIKN